MNLGGQPNNEIWYTTIDGVALSKDTLDNADFGANILTHKYEDGNGVITFDSAVTYIGHSAFHNCTSLESIILPKCVTEIGYDAFMDCTSLTSITIPDSVTEIRSDAFYGCTTALASVYITDLSAWCAIDFEKYTSNPLWNGASLYINGNAVYNELAIPDNITRISDYAFYGLGATLYPLTITSNITHIGAYAFDGCTIYYVKFEGAPPETVGTDIFGSNYSVPIIVPSEYLKDYQAKLPNYTNISAQ